MFSKRTAWDFTPNDLVAARQRAGKRQTIVDLTVSNPTVIALPYPGTRIRAAMGHPNSLRYEPDAAGLLSAREAVARNYARCGVAVDPDDLVLTASSSESYAYLLKLLCDPGDSILVPRPSYPLFDDLSRLEGVRMKDYPLRCADGWRADLDALRAAVDDTVRAIFVVSPNNPTGSYLRQDELAGIESVAAEHGLAVVCDEVFSEYVWRDAPDRVRCAAQGANVLTFSLGGLSKSACLPQMKLGWILVGGPASDRNVAVARLEMIGDTFLSVGTPVQHAAAELLEAGAEVREALSCRVRASMEALAALIGPNSPITVLPVDAGWYAVLRLPRWMTGEQWASLIVEQEGVLTHPGEFFGFEEDGIVVLSLIAEPEAFDRGVRSLAACVMREA